MKFVVVYIPEDGHLSSFGPFTTYEEAEKWMKEDVEWAVKNNELAFDIKLSPLFSQGRCTLAEMGEWQVVELDNP